MITSTRKFGVEIEFTTKTNKDLAYISTKIPVVHDGSLRDAGVIGGEYVSPILNQSTGYQEIHRVCAELKKCDASGNHPATSVHVHLDGGKETKLEVYKVRDKSSKEEMVSVSNKLSNIISPSELMYLVSRRTRPSFLNSGITIHTSKLDNILYFSCVPISRHPILNYTYYLERRSDRFNWLKNVFYFYTMYSEVMENIVSKSRRFGNTYCTPLNKSYDLKDIIGTNNMDELRELWYKNNEQHTHYDDSRYHNVNLHCFWSSLGTVEIRSHGGTIDPDKILLWVKLHQKIVDKLETISTVDIKAGDNIYESFVNFIEEPVLQEYVKRLLGYYSSISINK